MLHGGLSLIHKNRVRVFRSRLFHPVMANRRFTFLRLGEKGYLRERKDRNEHKRICLTCHQCVRRPASHDPATDPYRSSAR